ncbi:MAG TPA: hypothetical protein PLO37_04030 [Candidatus Hydrogenedentes bacterium]|nr:hypothetical protein [Candidatus Hydrogenedentota bacterium]HPG65992.1 hypothetical protein [Candidatus Hydrogenedentota bacterium]
MARDALTRLVLLTLALVVLVQMVHADTDKQDSIAMIERYENFYDECTLRYSTEAYTYQSYLLGDESKLEALPEAGDASLVYAAMGKYHRMDITRDLGEFSQYEIRVSDGERDIQWSYSDRDRGGQAVATRAKSMPGFFPTASLRPFHWNFSQAGVDVDELEIERRGSDVVLRWPRYAGETVFEMCCERWQECLRPRWTKSILVEDGTLLFERKYEYHDGVDENGKKSMRLTRMIDLSPAHEICTHYVIEEIDLSPSLDHSSFEPEFWEETWVRNEITGTYYRPKEGPLPEQPVRLSRALNPLY